MKSLLAAMPPPMRAMTAFIVLMTLAILAALFVGGRFLFAIDADPGLMLWSVGLVLLFIAAFGWAGLLLVRNVARTHQRTKLAEERLRSLSDHALDLIAIVDGERRVSYINAAVDHALGRPAAAYHGRDLLEWVHPDDQPVAVAALRQATEDPGRAHAVETRIAHADSSWCTFEMRVRAHFDTDGVNGIIINARDITHRKRTEHELHERIRHAQLTRELARALAGAGKGVTQVLEDCATVMAAHFEAAIVAFWTWERDEQQLVLRATAGREWLRRETPQCVALTDGVVGRVARERRPVLHLGESRNPGTREGLSPAGEMLPTEIVAALTYPLLVEGRLAGVVRLLSFEPVPVQHVEAVSNASNWIAAGIERARIEAALRSSEEKFRQLVDTIEEVFWIYSLTTDSMVYVSPAYETIWGRPLPYALRGTEAWLDTIHADDRGRVAQIWAERGAGESTGEYAIEYRVTRPDGEVRWIQDIGYPVLDESGQPFRLAGVAQDITQRKTAEERLAVERAYFATLFNAAPIAIAVHDEHARVQLVNTEFERLFGYSASEVAGRDLNEVIVPPEERENAEQLTRAAALGRVSGERTRLRKDGSTVDVAIAGCSVILAGRLPVVFAMYLDIGDRRRAQLEQERLAEQLRQSQKMEAIGRLAGGVAHDFNNLLTVIVGHTQMLLDQVEPASDAWGELEEVRRASERASALTRQLLAFSRRQILQPVPLDLNSVVSEMERMLRRLIRAEIRFQARLASGLWTVRADPGQMQQVLLNLVVNARDAMPDGGELTVTTANERISGDRALTFGGEVTTGDYVVLSVRDTGIGMDAATLAQAFEPFYTTKEPGAGTGLGLATVYGIVRQSGGIVAADSKPGQGTTVRVFLPRASEPAEAPSREGDASPSPARRATVLVAEDEDGVRRVIRTALQKHGFDVIEARDGAAALATTHDLDRTIDLLVTDVVMPGMSGRELAERLRERSPALPVLFISGYTEDEVIRGGVRAANTDFLEKPFRPQTLLQRVTKLMS